MPRCTPGLMQQDAIDLDVDNSGFSSGGAGGTVAVATMTNPGNYAQSFHHQLQKGAHRRLVFSNATILQSIVQN